MYSLFQKIAICMTAVKKQIISINHDGTYIYITYIIKYNSILKHFVKHNEERVESAVNVTLRLLVSVKLLVRFVSEWKALCN